MLFIALCYKTDFNYDWYMICAAYIEFESFDFACECVADVDMI